MQDSGQRLCDLNEESLNRYQNWLRQNGRSESTIKGHLAHIKSSLSSAKNHKLILATPSVKMPKRAKKSKVMKGRAITLEEFERMLSKIEDVLFPPGVLLKEENRSLVVASWEYLLRGLWLSGLRLDESMQLHWTDRTRLCVEDLDKRQPMLWIPGSCQKSGQDAVLPMAPEFAEFLRETAPNERQGFVFNPLPRRHRYGDRIGTLHVSKTISRIGEAANVKVHEGKRGQVKYASAHDFRRSFGERWAPRVTSTVLRELMRHEDIQTTLRYYVGENAQRTAALLWEVHRGLGDQMGTRASGASASVDATAEATRSSK